MTTSRVWPLAEVSKHNTLTDLWIIINGKVYDLTSFVASHPGGSQVLLQQAGQDGTSAFLAVHPKDLISRLGYEKLCVGTLDPKDAASAASAAASSSSSTHSPPHSSNVSSPSVSFSSSNVIVPYVKPPLDHMLNVFDFESVAQHVMTKPGWDYYSSGADDEVTLRENHAAFHRLWLRPRIMINVDKITMDTTLLGCPSTLPVYITATALAKLADPLGEIALINAAHSMGVVYMLPTLSSCSQDEMLEAIKPGQNFFMQLYVNRNRDTTADIVRKAERVGCRGLFITVDAPQLGKREKDMRNKFANSIANVQKDDDKKGALNRSQGTARAISSFIDPTLCWADLKWFRSLTKMPIVLKGVQTGEDAILAVKHNVQAIVVSNHGGRQQDFSRSGIEVLAEVMAALRSINAVNLIEVYVDGGIRRGSDIFKALALGARAVGIGRPFLYGLAGYGQEGVERVMEILKDEFVTTMRLMGAPTLKDIVPAMVSTKNISDHFAVIPRDYLFTNVYQPMIPAGQPSTVIVSKL